MNAGPEQTSWTSGWFPDPLERHEFRFHNGREWTADVAEGGHRFVDPHGTAPTAGQPASGNRIAVVSLVFGVIALAIGYIPFVFVLGAVAALVAITCGVIGLRRAGPEGHRRGAAVAGLITGVSGVFVAVGGAVLTGLVVDELDEFENPGAHEVGVVTCEADGNAWVAAGSITNLEDDRRDYTLSVEFVRPGTDNTWGRVRIEVADVGAGESAPFQVRRVVDLDEVECLVTEVDGPAPFGLDIGR